MARKPEEIEREIRTQYEQKYADAKERRAEAERNKKPGFYYFDYSADPDSKLAKDSREFEMNAKIQFALNLNKLNLPFDDEYWQWMVGDSIRRDTARCPFCKEEFGRSSGHEIFDLHTDVGDKLELDGKEKNAFLDQFGDPFFRLKMHLILLHDNPSKIEVDRTKEEFWRDVTGFIDVQSRVSNRVFLGEIMRIWRELEGPRKEKSG